MRRSITSQRVGATVKVVLGAMGMVIAGCGAIDLDGFLGLQTCDIFNCDGIFFAGSGENHDGMDDDESMDDHDEDDMDDDHDDDGTDDQHNMDDMDDDHDGVDDDDDHMD